jgi:hypothetical protein
MFDSDIYDLSWPLTAAYHLDFLAMNMEEEEQQKKWKAKDGNHEVHFEYLARHTNTTGLVNSFDCGTMAEREQVASQYLSGEALSTEICSSSDRLMDSRGFPSTHEHPWPSLSYSGIDLTLPDQSVEWTQQTPVPEQHFEGDMRTIDPRRLSIDLKPCTYPSTQLDDPLLSQIERILSLLREASVQHSSRLPGKQEGKSEFNEDLCRSFFNPRSIRKFLDLYWAGWNPNCPVIHKPTFDECTLPPGLLAAMTLLGACLSPHPSDAQNAQLYFDTVETAVFEDRYLTNVANSPSSVDSPEKLKRTVQALQAAYITCNYQAWEGSDDSKRRIRRLRHNTVVAVSCRAIQAVQD